MSRFDGQLILVESDDERTATLHDRLVYESDLIGRVEVPAGFSTDGASVPKLFWNILPPWGKYGRAAVVHDYLYRTQTRDRLTCDRVLLEAMTACGVGFCSRWTIYRAVRMFGGFAWKADSLLVR